MDMCRLLGVFMTITVNLKKKGIACYLCLAYSFTLQYDRIANFTIPSTMCPGLKSIFPPVSYSIGVWKPQKYIWLMVLAMHLPPRFFYAIVYKNHYSLGDSIHRTKRWFCVIVKLHYFLLVIEALGLTAVSVIDIESNFKVHACCFALWLIPFNLNMLFNNLLHYHSGIRKLRPMATRQSFSNKMRLISCRLSPIYVYGVFLFNFCANLQHNT
uniref:CWH43-like N-terminal domain-containing protein n=1 Tax=Meloidogyne incognita TaxID=6306 RepID=A0A914NB64_MELIC